MLGTINRVSETFRDCVTVAMINRWPRLLVAAAPPPRGVALRNGKARFEPRHRRPTSALDIKVLFPGMYRREKVLSWASRPRGPTSQRFDGLRLPNPATVGARLMSFAQEWDALTTYLYVRSIVRDGYRLELLSPQLTCFATQSTLGLCVGK